MSSLRANTAVLVPVYFPPDTPEDAILKFLQRVLLDTFAFVEPTRTLFVCDGEQPAWQIINDLAGTCEPPFRTLLQMPNGGKGRALVVGIRELLKDEGTSFVITRDCDGNHFAWDMPRMMAVAQWLRGVRAAQELVVVGGRSDRARALGMVRAEVEELLNRLTLASLKYHLAKERGEVLADIFSSTHGNSPDFHSGYKLYSRGVCRRMCELPWESYGSGNKETVYRYGMELVPFVEAVLMRAHVVEIPRLGHVQRVTGHGAYERPEVVAELASWVFSRLDLPTDQAARVLDNTLPALKLLQDPEGRERLSEIRRLSLKLLATSRCEPVPESHLPRLPDYF
jgi:hypothetical protein